MVISRNMNLPTVKAELDMICRTDEVFPILSVSTSFLST